MSFHINSDKEKIRGVNPKLIGDNETTIRVGAGADEREILRLELDAQSGLPRVGINRTGQRINNIDIDAGGSGYTLAPTVVIDPPPAGGTQALASAFIFNGAVVSIAVNDPGNGYTTVPNIVFTGGNGAGAAATAVLDSVDFELDINGAIRTSTSIISDTARILNLDIENFITPDLNMRAPNLKTYMNGTGTPWAANVIVSKGAYRYSASNVYEAKNTGTTGTSSPTHKNGIEVNGTVNFKHIGFRVNDPNDYKFLETGNAGEFPRSITPILGDRSDKIATTEYVLNLATNDVGGRVYVSQQIGSDLNDGRSAVNPVRTIKKAAQIAWSTPGVKETLIISGGDYVEDNPISLPPDCSVVGDNLRLVIIRPANLGKHIFKFGDKNYVTGVTYRDKVDANGDSIGTWDFAMVFDDKQRVLIDNEVNGDFGVEFPIGHQVFGPEQFRIAFQNNTGLSLLQSGVEAVGLNTGARANVIGVTYNSETGANAYVSGTIDVQIKSGALIEGDQYSYVTSAATGGALSLTISSTSGSNTLRFTTNPTTDIPVSAVVFLDDTDDSSFTSGYYQVASIDTANAPTYWDVAFNPILGAPSWDTTQSETILINSATTVSNTIDTVSLKSIRAEGEVVSYDEDITSTLPIARVDFSLQGDPSIATGGFQDSQFGNAEDIGGIVFYTSALVGRTNTHEFKEGQEIIITGMPTVSPDLSFLNGKQRIYKVLEDADGRSRRFVIPKKLPSLTTANFDPGQFATVQSYSKSVTLTLLNSPNKFPLAQPVERRFQDACQLIRNNRDYIAEEVVGIINEQFSKDYFSVYNIDTVNNTFDIFLGTTDHVNTYVSGGTVTFGGTSYAISDFLYDNAVNGVATITTTNAAVSALSEDDTVKLADILIECSAGQKIYPAYSSPTSGNNINTDGDEQCKQDVIHFLNALVRDLEFGSNHNIIEAAGKYIVGGKIAFIEDEIIQNVRAIEYARELAIYAMCNWRIKNRTTGDPSYVTKHATSTRYVDPTIISATAGSPACDDVRSAIDTLSFLWVDVISNNASGTYIDAAYLIARNADVIADQALIDTEVVYPTLNLSDVHQRKCRRDIKIVLRGLARDLVLGGNHGIVSTAESYFSGTVLSGIPEAQRAETIYAFQRVKLYAIQAMRNWSDGNVLQTTPTGSTYVPTTGAMTVVIPDPAVLPVANSDRIAFVEGAITYSCAAGGGGNDASPYRTDLNFGQSFLITNVTSSGGNTTISLNVGVAGANTDSHTFVSALANGTKVIYGPVTLSSPIPKFEDWSILNGVGAAPIGIFTPTTATYDPANGDFTFTTATAHGLSASNTIRFQPESLTFTCDMDNNATEHKYPKDGQPAYGNSLPIVSTTTNTVTVNVGASGPNVQFTPSAATYDPATGSLVLEIGNHTLDVGEGIVIADNSLTFTCTSDGNVSNETYPRPSDPASGKSIPITGKTSTSITVNVGASPAGQQYDHTFVSAAANAVSHLPQSTHSFVSASTDAVSAYSSSTTAICAGVESSIDTALELFEDILDGTTIPGSTTQTFGTLYDTSAIVSYPDSFITDFQNQRMAIRGRYDDFPIIEASPYTQNASVISFRGGGGALIDGTKVKQPNCPFPGLEPDGSASFPNQGKSMVAAAFTIVSFGGTGYKVIEDGYTQLVSVFVIFCQDGVLCETGGYASITNSATNFGTFALRGTGFRRECYEFDTGTINVVSQTPTGRTTLTVGGIGREPLEHYIVKIDGYTNADPAKEFFIDAVSGVTVGPPFSATLVIDDGVGNGLSLIETSTGNTVSGLTALQQALTPAAASNATIKLHRPSIVNSSSHTWEFAGSGNNYLALPENGGTKVEANEQVSQDYGRVYVSGTDELGDFKVGTFARIENRTGNITFTGTVTISEVEFLKLKGGDVVVTGFDASNTLGGANTSDSKLPTQKAVKDFITNNLGPYINKPFSTNAVPRALVELTDSGKISIDQIPALRPFQVFTVATQADRLKIEGALAGDIAIQQDTSQSFILNNDLESLFLGFQVDPSLTFNINDVYTGTPSTGRIQATEYREGVLRQILITDGGSGYTVPPTVSISGGNPASGAVAATATCTIANGEVVTITIDENLGLVGGSGYTTQPVITIQAPPGAGTQAQADGFIESRLYGDIVNNIKMLDTDTFDDSTAAPNTNTINISRVVNTSSTNNANWVSLSSNQIAASDITSGVIETDRLASGGAANSFTFLRGDQNFAPAVQSIKGAETRYFARLASQASNGANAFIFTSNSDALIGHSVVANVAGIAANTNINGVTTVGGLTTVSLNNPITATIALGTVIEFERGASPLTFDSSNTVGNFIDSVVIANPGSGYTDGQYFDIGLDGGTGVDLRANLIISGGAVTDATVTNAGSGYNADFQITPNPSAIGGGSNLVLLGKVSTVNKQFANVAVDIQRVSDLTISADLFGTIGVARFKKSQFNIGQEGNGSITIKTGPDSGLDADLLDGQQGSYYLNGAFFVDSSINPDKLASGTYSIDISGKSTNTLRVDTGISNPTSNPAPSGSVQGLTLNTVFNSSNGLLSAFPSVDTGTSNSAKHLVMTLRNGESGIDATFGGVRQLAFANDDRIYLRGSGDGVTNYGSWYEIWNSGNQGIDSGLDADKLDNKEGIWYQDGWNIQKNEIFDTRLPTWRSSTKFRNKIEVKSYSGSDVSYRILVRQVLDTGAGGDFSPGSQINIYNINKQDIGDFFIDNAPQLNDQNDSTNSYTMLIGRLASGGNLEQAVFLGVAGDERRFENYEIFDSNTVQFAELGNNSGSGFLRLGRYDGNFATNPYIYFNSSQAQAVDNNNDPSYNSAIIADGGNATEGSGSLEFKVVDENALTVNSNILWNAGNVAFNSSNVVSTASLKSAVVRDTNGDFSAGTISANLTGAASLNVLKTGDTMTGGLTITGNNNLNIQGTGTLSVGGNTTITADLTVDSGTLYVNSTNNRVLIGSTTESNPAIFNVYDDAGNSNFATNSALSSQITLYQSSVFRQKNNGESGIILQHGNSSPAQWGISAHRTGANVGELIVRTRTANATSAERLKISNGGNVLPGATNDQEIGSGSLKWANVHTHIVTVKDSTRIGDGTANAEADIHLRGGGTGNGGGRGFRLGSNIGGGADVFEIYSSQTNGSDDWKSLAAGSPALAIKGSNNRVAINTNQFQGVDTTVSPNVTRNYQLNIDGDVNFNGTLYQDNAEFVTSRWTESPNGNNIYRASFVGINFIQSGTKEPQFPLEVYGGSNILGSSFTNEVNSHTLYANGDPQWLDTYGVFKANRNTCSENITIPQNTNCMTAGPVSINNNVIITIADGASWSIV